MLVSLGLLYCFYPVLRMSHMEETLHYNYKLSSPGRKTLSTVHCSTICKYLSKNGYFYFLKIIFHSIKKMQESGVIENIKLKYNLKAPSRWDKDVTFSAKHFLNCNNKGVSRRRYDRPRTWNLIGIFLVLATGLASVLVIFIIEIFTKYRQNQTLYNLENFTGEVNDKKGRRY